MRDNCGREIDYLRVSDTDRCNLRCVYCMPEEGVEPVSHREILSFEEILRVCRAAAKLGVRRIRLTGGEPLVRRGIVDLVRRVKEIDGIEQVSVTTNGLLFCDMAQDLAAAGLGGVNVSLDTLDPAVFCRITRRDSFGKALEAVRTALELGLLVKVNCVAAEEFGMQHPLSVAGLAKDHPVDVRFIEMMPIGLGNGFTPIPGGRIRTALERLYGPMTACAGNGGGPASYGMLPGFCGRVGFINALSDRFCDSCNRVRLTAEGFLKLCLHYDVGIDLRGPLRDGISDEVLAALMREAILQKPVGHQFGARGTAHVEQHRMVQIGG